jgi:hypothetical protein
MFDEGLRNLAKRHVPASGMLATLTLADFATLQQDVNGQFGNAAVAKTRFEPTRNALTSLPIANGTVSEGDLVQLATYVTVARDEGAETVNCASADDTTFTLRSARRAGPNIKGSRPR